MKRMRPLSKLPLLLTLKRGMLGRTQRIYRWMRRAPQPLLQKPPPPLHLQLDHPSLQQLLPQNLALLTFLMSLPWTFQLNRSQELPLLSQLAPNGACPDPWFFQAQETMNVQGIFVFGHPCWQAKGWSYSRFNLHPILQIRFRHHPDP